MSEQDEKVEALAEEYVGTFRFKLVLSKPPIKKEGVIAIYCNKEHAVPKEERLPLEADDQFTLITAVVCADYLYHIDGKWLALKEDPSTPKDDNEKEFLPIYIEVSMRDDKPIPDNVELFMRSCKLFYHIVFAAYRAGAKKGLEKGIRTGLGKAKMLLKQQRFSLSELLHDDDDIDSDEVPKKSLNPKFH